jgi:SAM-dependent methyltransferase
MALDTWIKPIFDIEHAFRGLREYKYFFTSWKQYANMPGTERIMLRDAYPCLYDRTTNTAIDRHYFYQNIWAMKCIKDSNIAEHVDVGSLASFVGLLSTIVKVIFIDIRPLEIELPNFESRPGSILQLPFADGSVQSISCLHVAEHIGLGRYGDPLDPMGTQKAAHELARTLAPGGHLYFSLPVGVPRTCFNAHRIHSPNQIMQYFEKLDLVSFCAVTDKGEYHINISPSDMDNARYACGMFHFTKRV